MPLLRSVAINGGTWLSGIPQIRETSSFVKEETPCERAQSVNSDTGILFVGMFAFICSMVHKIIKIIILCNFVHIF